MHIRQMLQRRPTLFSVEFFPPKTAQALAELHDTLPRFEALRPDFADVTYGAGGGTREATQDLVAHLKRRTTLDPIPHLTCVCHQQGEIDAILSQFAQAGVDNVLALGGDLPRGREDWDRSQDAFRYAADLVRHIRRFNEKGGHPAADGFGIGVAGFPEGHPATPNRLAEMDHLKAKVDAGADYIVTQLFMDNHDFHDFVERCDLAGIRVPILAGIMPVTNLAGLRRLGDLAAGARFPARLLKALHQHADNPADVERVGLDWAIAQCHDLLAHDVRGLHLYTLNKPQVAEVIWSQIEGDKRFA